MSNEMTYPVVRNLSHDGEDYVKGGTVEMTEEQAAPLLRLGVISEAIETIAAPATSSLAEGNGTPEPVKPAPTKPEGEELTQSIMCVIEELDHKKDFTQGGNPKVASVEAVLGYDVTAAEVANAWDVYPEGNE